MSEQEYFLSNLDDKRIKDLERRVKLLEQLLPVKLNLIPDRVEKAFMLLDNIASATNLRELADWREEVRKFLGLEQERAGE